MDMNQNSIYLNNETIQSKSISEIRTPFVVGNEFNDLNDIWIPIVKELDIPIQIPEGYQVIPGEETRVQTSIDQHNLSTVVVKEKIPVELNFIDESGNAINMDMAVDIYLIKLIGSLYYNSVISNLEPIATSARGTNTKYNSFGGIVMNDVIGYVSELSHVPQNIEEQLSYNIVINSINSTNRDENTQKENKQQSTIRIQNHITQSITIVITYNQGPIS